jgi:hypothetical protein
VRIKITRTIIADVYAFDETDDMLDTSIVDIEDFRDSLVDDINDSVDVGIETTDGKFNIVTREVVEVSAEVVR